MSTYTQEPTLLNETGDQYSDIRQSKYWMDLVNQHDKVFLNYHQTCDGIDQIYADLKYLTQTSAEDELRLFWANIEVLKPSTYARKPEPVVDARFKERNELKTHASEILERSLMYERDRAGMHTCLEDARDDLLLSNRGVIWPRLASADDGARQVEFDHIDRRDFIHEPARKWAEMGWLGKRIYLTKQRMQSRWPRADLSRVNFGNTKDTEDEYKVHKKACVFEIWSKEHGVVVWFVDGPEEVLEIAEPFMKLETFWPVPRPAMTTLQRRSLIPVPDFLQIKNQLEQINDLTARISMLSEALVVAGVYDASAEDLKTAIEKIFASEEKRVRMVPVKGNKGLGGVNVASAFQMLPLFEVAQTIKQCIELRKHLMLDVYEVTGISDIMRGTTDAAETLGAQQLKSQYGSVRVRQKVGEMERLASDAFRIAAEMMAEHFPIQQLVEMSQYEKVPTREDLQRQAQGVIQQAETGIQQLLRDPQAMAAAMQAPEQALQRASQERQKAQAQAQEIMKQTSLEDVDELLKSQRMRPFVLQVETESTVAPDENAMKQRTAEFMNALAPMLEQLFSLVNGNPEAVDFAIELLRIGLKPYRVGRSMDAAIEEFASKIKQRLSQPQPNPEALAAQAEAERKKQEMQFEIEKFRADMQVKFQELQIKEQELEVKRAEASSRSITTRNGGQLEAKKTQSDIRLVDAKIEETKAKTAQIRATPKEATSEQRTL